MMVSEKISNHEDERAMEVYREWRRRRQIMTYIGYLQSFMFGLEYTSVGVSGLYYFTNDIRPRNAKMFYGMAMGAMFLSAFFSNPITGKIMDRTRKLRAIFLTLMAFRITGNFVYVISYSAWFPVMGRFICGLADGCIPVMTGEYRRIYSQASLPKVTFTYQLMLSVGLMLGPCTPVLFGNVNFNIGSIHIDEDNAFAFFNAVVLAVFSIVAYFGLMDLTLHPGYDIFKQVNDYDGGIASKSGVSSERSMLSMKDLMTNMDFILVVLTNGFYHYISVTIELNAMVMSISNFHWTMSKLSLVVLLSTSASVVLFLFAGRKMYKYVCDIYMINILGFVVFCILLNCLMLPSLIPETFKSTVSQYLLIGIIIFWKYFGAVSGLTCGMRLVFYLVPDHSASFAEGFRYATVRVFAFAGFVFAGFLYNKSIYVYVFPIFCCVLFLCVVLLTLRKKIYFK